MNAPTMLIRNYVKYYIFMDFILNCDIIYI